ncbi:hypothetical protein BM221_006504 [Beauveria bassiana]|uniref:Chromo domain-containing protein n=1 Tax=Beauveria bassiana TaxID=176275 RepID=A0A2N6NHT9_BEABA|nr:hypothetical protein BM221_006504 [Beauveria bassiana]
MTSPHRGRKRLQPPRIKKIKITIPLPSRPADYVPNSGPPLRRLALQPPADSTAFIDDRILLPPSGLAADGRPLPKRMRYIVGWRDLPAARLLVSAMDVLDYVSPHALEEWEYSMELELDVDRARLAAERQALKTQQTLLGRADELPLPKAARPPPHHTSIEAAVVAETEDGDGEQGRLRGGALSLSTPKKRKMDDFLDGYTSDESPSEQLFFDIAKSAQKEDDSLSPGKEESDDKVPEVRSAPVAPVALMAPMASVYPKMPILTSDDGRSRSVKSQPSKKPKLATNTTLPLMSMPSTKKSNPQRSESAAMRFPLANSMVTQRPMASPRPTAPAKTHSSRPITEYLLGGRNNSSSTPHPPAKKAPNNAPKPPVRKLLHNTSQSLAKKLSKSTSQSLAKKMSNSSLQHSAKNLSSKAPFEPHLADTNRKPKGKPVYRSHVARKVEKHNRKTNQKPWTPSSGKARRPPVFDSSSEADDETDWAVDRIEDMELYDVEGRGLVRYFKVRWEGDWPPDQNPTWEPEENLPDDLVHEFCRTFKSRKKGSSEQSRPTRNDADQAARLPPLRPTNRIGEDRENDRPSSAHSGMFVYSSDDGMEKHRWDAPNS